MRRAWLQIGMVTLGVAAFLALLLWLNPVLRDRLRGHNRYRFNFSGIECAAPPGLDRAVFLEEVQYYAELTDQIDLLRDDLAGHLTQAFSRHPWVRAVEGVHIRPAGIEVRLQFRRPVLAVRTGADLRAVDEQGILLPKNAATTGLPLLEGKVGAPRGPEGSAWGDARVEDAARKASAPK